MNRLMIAVMLAANAVVPANAQEQKVEAADPAAAAIVADCSSRRFETSVEIEKDGEKRQTKMKLCAAANQNDAAWVKTLSDAKSKIAAHPEISADSKAKIATEIDAEIAKTRMGEAKRELPLVVARPEPRQATTTRIPSAPAVEGLAAPVKTASVKTPRLSIKCLAPGEKGGGSTCSTSLARTTQFAVLAESDLGPGTSLRFLRRGDAKASLTLAPMRQGEVFRSKLPSELCAGVASTKIEIQVMSANQVVNTVGPFSLRC